MTPIAVLLVLLSALLHLAWNARVRQASGDLRFVFRLTLAGGIGALVLANRQLLSSALWKLWPFLLATSVLHALYFAGLAAAYSRSDLASTYASARGFGILLTAVAAAWLIGETLSAGTWVGVVLISLGAGLFYLKRSQILHKDTLGWTMMVGLMVAGYSLVDSQAMHRIAPLPYLAVMFLGSSFLLAPWAFRIKKATPIRSAWRSGLGSMGSYAFMLFAYQHGLVAPLLALRQIAPGLAPLWGWVVLGERPTWRTTLGSLAVVLGSVLAIIS